MSAPKKHNRSSYVHGCRCVACCDANTEYQRSRRAERQLHLEDAPHGTWGSYVNWGCRCTACRQANTDGCKAWRERA